MLAVSHFKSLARSKSILFENFIEFSDSFFKFVTFNLTTCSRTKSLRENLKIIFSDIFFWFSAINVCLFVTLSAANSLRKSFDMKAFTFAVPLLTSTSLVVVKCLTVYCNKRNISDILKYLKDIFPKNKLQQRNYKIKRYFRSYKIFATIYAFMFMVPCVCVMIIPLINLLSTGEKAFPLNTFIPFDFQHNVTYAITFLWTIWSCANSVIILIAIDTLMFVLITLISMEFDVLQIDLIGLKNVQSSAVEMRAEKLIQRHNDLIAYSGKLEKVFSPSFLYNFVQSSFVICLTAFQYTTSSEATQLLFNGSYCAAILNQIWLLSFFGQKVINASERVGDGAYGSGWENTDNVKVRKAVMMTIQRAQRPTKLTAMNFTEISLTSFTSVKHLNFY